MTSMTFAAGIMFMTPEKDVLFLKRGKGGDHPGEWCFPGGQRDGEETAEATAEREAVEELGFLPKGTRAVLTRSIAKNAAADPDDAVNPVPPLGDPVDYTTFIQRVKDRFDPKLNGEHTAFRWAKASKPPSPMHPGAQIALDRLSMNELDVARAIVAGDLVSPQKYQNVWLFALRITGTGMAYRRGLKEFVWRDSENYLTEDFLARASGLAVIWEHPQGKMLNSEEYSKRSIGAVMLPYFKGDEVWGITKIYNDAAATALNNGVLSTSPGVVFSDQSVNEHRTLDDGSKLLIEGDPGLLDHLAICELGVWDKAGPPTGVLNETLDQLERVDSMPTEEEKKVLADAEKARADADAGQKLDKILGYFDSMSNRLDAIEMADKARKDADEKEKAEKADKAKVDRARIDAEERAQFKRDDAEHCAKDDADEDEAKKKFIEGGDTEEVAADKARKDRKDAMKARKDAAEEEEKKKTEEEARADAQKGLPTLAEFNAMKQQIASLTAMNQPVSEDDRQAFAASQVRADAVYMGLGKRAPQSMTGESLSAYNLRLTRGVQSHSAKWSKTELHKLSADVMATIQDEIYADAQIAARNPIDMQPGALREIRHEDPSTGQRSTTFVGPDTFIMAMKRPSRRVVAINTQKG